MLVAKQTAKFAAPRLNALSHWQFVNSGHFTILEVHLMTSVNIDYLSVEYCRNRDFYSLVSNRDEWNPNTVIPQNICILMALNTGRYLLG